MAKWTTLLSCRTSPTRLAISTRKKSLSPKAPLSKQIATLFDFLKIASVGWVEQSETPTVVSRHETQLQFSLSVSSRMDGLTPVSKSKEAQSGPDCALFLVEGAGAYCNTPLLLSHRINLILQLPSRIFATCRHHTAPRLCRCLVMKRGGPFQRVLPWHHCPLLPGPGPAPAFPARRRCNTTTAQNPSSARWGRWLPGNNPLLRAGSAVQVFLN